MDCGDKYLLVAADDYCPFFQYEIFKENLICQMELYVSSSFQLKDVEDTKKKTQQKSNGLIYSHSISIIYSN